MTRETGNTITVEEAIQRLKWEIIAQDWSLSPKRILLLEKAFLFLKEHYADRKPVHNILTMADSLLHYIKDRGENIPSASIDFLKEAMAHVVNIYESEDLEPEKEERLFKILYYRFDKLKGKIRSGRSIKDTTLSAEPDDEPGQEDTEAEGGDEAFNPENIEKIREKISSLQFDAEPADDLDYDIGELIGKLQSILSQADNLTAKIRNVVGTLREFDSGDILLQGEEESSPIKNCPPVELREIVIGGQPFYLQESSISRISRLSPAKASVIRQTKQVPLKDLASPFKRMPRQFYGVLGRLTSGELKKIKLPVIIPQGPELPDHPDVEANMAVAISKGNLAGVILCSAAGQKTETMFKFQMLKNGDTIGRGFTGQEKNLRVINIAPVLQRNGLAVP